MSNQPVKGVSDGLGGCGFYFYCFRRSYVVINRLIRKGGERWRERNNKSVQEEAVASS